MGPSEKSEQKRDSAIDLLSLLLNERHRRGPESGPSVVFDRQVRHLLSGLLWMYSEADGKYGGCRYWSTGALESRQSHGRLETSRRKVGDDALRHEHLFPRAQLIGRLLAMAPPDHSEISDELRRLNIGVVVTEREHRLLADEGDPNDPWTRYRRANVDWLDMWDSGV